MSRPHIPLLTLVLVPILALHSPTREPRGPLECPDRGLRSGGQRPSATVVVSGAQEGEPWDRGVLLYEDERLALPLPEHQGQIEVRVRADHDDDYVLEVPVEGGWSEVGVIGAGHPPGLSNRPTIAVQVGTAERISIAPKGGDGRGSVALICFRGARWPIPVWLMAALAMGALVVVLRSIPHPLADKLLHLWARADPASAVLFGLGVLTTPLLLVTILPAMLGLRAWHGGAAPSASST